MRYQKLGKRFITAAKRTTLARLSLLEHRVTYIPISDILDVPATSKNKNYKPSSTDPARAGIKYYYNIFTCSLFLFTLFYV